MTAPGRSVSSPPLVTTTPTSRARRCWRSRRALDVRAADDRPVPPRPAGGRRRARGLRVAGPAHAHRVPHRPGARAGDRRAGQRHARPQAPAARRPRAVRVASLGCAVAPSILVLDVLRLVQGLCGAAGIVLARAIVRDRWSGLEAARIYAALMTALSLGPILAPTIGGGLLHITDWRGLFVVLAGWGVALLVAGRGLGSRDAPAVGAPPAGLGRTLRVMRRLLRDRVFTGYTVGAGLVVRRAVLLHRRIVVRLPGRLRRLAAGLRAALRPQRRRAARSEHHQPPPAGERRLR